MVNLFYLGLPGPRGKTGKPGLNGTPGTPGVQAYEVNIKGSKSSELLIPPAIVGKKYKKYIYMFLCRQFVCFLRYYLFLNSLKDLK